MAIALSSASALASDDRIDDSVNLARLRCSRARIDLSTFNEAFPREKRGGSRRRRGRGEKFDKRDGRADKKERRRALECLPCDEIKRGLHATITDRR